MSTELTDKEKEVKSSLSPRTDKVLEDKRLRLLKAFLADSGHEDLSLVDDIKKGFELTGALPRPAVFAQKFRPA